MLIKNLYPIARPLIISSIIVAALSIGLKAALATPPPPRVVLQALAAINSNQDTIEKNREAYNAFIEAKNNNLIQVGVIKGHCYDVNWQNLSVGRIEGCTVDNDPLQ